MPVALANIRSELLPGLFDVRGSYDMIPRQWDKVFKTHKSSMAVERSTQMAFVALPYLKDEGAATQFDNAAGERFTWAFVHIEVALGYAITRKAIDDLLYKAQFNPTNLKLQEAFAQFKEIQAANIFNLGTTYNSAQVGDGQAFFSTVHPYDGGTWSNTSSTPKSLNESTLLADMTNVRVQFVNERGLRILARARRLVVPPNLEGIAIRLTKTELRPGTADNDVNAILTLSGGLPEGHIVLDFLTSNFAWFLTTNIEGLIHMLRIPYESDMWVDNVTDNLLVKAYERYSFGINDPRAAWGEFPTA
jgi:phage major head subunit gpT-like protein